MSGWTPWRRTPAPIRTLCDETDRGDGMSPAEADRLAALYTRRQRPRDTSPAPRAEAGRWQPRRDGEAVPASPPPYPGRGTSAEQILAERLAEVTRDRDRLESVVDRLRARVRELEAATGSPADTLVMPRSRSGIPPVVRRGR